MKTVITVALTAALAVLGTVAYNHQQESAALALQNRMSAACAHSYQLAIANVAWSDRSAAASSCGSLISQVQSNNHNEVLSNGKDSYWVERH